MKIKQIEVSPDQEKVMVVFDLGQGSAEMFNISSRALYRMCEIYVAEIDSAKSGKTQTLVDLPEDFKALLSNLFNKPSDRTKDE